MGAEAAMETVSAPVEEREVRVPSVLRCGLLIAGVKVALRALGFPTTMKLLRRRVESVRLGHSWDRTTIAATEYQVALAGALYPGRALCLEQSLALYYCLRRAGVDVRFRLGVKPHPFEAHAWVEYRSEPLNDCVEHVNNFVALPDVAL